jgi:23S rRNA (guanosine2251-2'-O)-methyltransferase
MSARRSRGRPKPSGVHVVPGERAVLELLDAAPERVRRILLARDLPSVEAAAADAGVAIERVDVERLRSAAPEVEARGVLALADPPPVHALDALVALTLAAPGPRRLLVALDGIEDPQNVGAIARSCEFFGASGMFWSRDRGCPITPAVTRASAGATERLMLGEVGNLADALRRCKDAGLWVVGTVVDGGEPVHAMVRDGRLPDALVLVLGSEGAGLRRLTREHCDFLLTLPRRGSLGSLNVSAAAAAVLAMLTA